MPGEPDYQPLPGEGPARPAGFFPRLFRGIAAAATGATWVRNLSHGAGSVLTSNDNRIKTAQTILLHIGTLCAYGVLPPVQFAQRVNANQLSQDIQNIEILLAELKRLGEPEEHIEALKNTFAELKAAVMQYQLTYKDYVLFGFWLICIGAISTQCVVMLQGAPSDHLDISTPDTYSGLIIFAAILLTQFLLNCCFRGDSLGDLSARLARERDTILSLIEKANRVLAPLEVSTEALRELEARTNRFLREREEVLLAQERFLDLDHEMSKQIVGLKDGVNSTLQHINQILSPEKADLQAQLREIIRDGLASIFKAYSEWGRQQSAHLESTPHIQVEHEINFNHLIETQIKSPLLQYLSDQRHLNANDAKWVDQVDELCEKLFDILKDWFKDHQQSAVTFSENFYHIELRCVKLNREQVALQREPGASNVLSAISQLNTDVGACFKIFQGNISLLSFEQEPEMSVQPDSRLRRL